MIREAIMDETDPTKKKALPKQSLFDSKHVVGLGGNNVVCTRTFFTFSDVKRDFLVFIEGRIPL